MRIPDLRGGPFKRPASSGRFPFDSAVAKFRLDTTIPRR
jgi:hypothetical protein